MGSHRDDGLIKNHTKMQLASIEAAETNLHLRKLVFGSLASRANASDLDELSIVPAVRGTDLDLAADHKDRTGNTEAD
ncbi:MAG: hypothetical protein ACK5Y6_00935 [Pseudomonadota bacterium]|jgi:hypothetical protein